MKSPTLFFALIFLSILTINIWAQDYESVVGDFDAKSLNGFPEKARFSIFVLNAFDSVRSDYLSILKGDSSETSDLTSDQVSALTKLFQKNASICAFINETMMHKVLGDESQKCAQILFKFNELSTPLSAVQNSPDSVRKAYLGIVNKLKRDLPDLASGTVRTTSVAIP